MAMEGKVPGSSSTKILLLGDRAEMRCKLSSWAENDVDPRLLRAKRRGGIICDRTVRDRTTCH